MSEATQEKTPEQIQHESNKFVRERLAWLHYRMNSVQFYLEESQMAHEARGILASFCTDLQAKIEAVEPPAVQQALPQGRPLEMDLTHVKPQPEAAQ